MLLHGLGRESATHAWPHARAWGQNALHVAFGPDAVRFRLDPPIENDVFSWIGANGGFRAADDDLRNSTRRLNARFLTDLPAYRERVRALASQPPPDAATFNRHAQESQLAFLRSCGLEPIYVIPPQLRDTRHLARIAAEGLYPRLIDLNDPQRFPALFSVENRWDEHHVNRNGAEIASRLLADALLREIAR